MPDIKTNDEQIAYWNEKAGPKWVAFQDRLDAQIAPFTRVVLDRAGLRPGDRVLDIGCGCGATTLETAGRVKPDGFVTGVDISRPMLQRARDRAKAEGINTVEFIEADAQTFGFSPGTFDAAISRFGVMFFFDPVVAFTNIRRALAPNARLCFICWRSMPENPWMTIPLRAAAQHLEMPPPPDPNAPGPFAFADAARVRGILESAGFTNVQIDKYDTRMSIGSTGTLDDAADFTLIIGPVSALLMDKPDSVRKAVRTSIYDALKPYHTPNGVVLDSATWLVSAKNG